jgi:predicted alpha/beta hydrolase
MHPDFLFGDADLPELARFAEFKAPIRFLQIADDPWGTPTNVASIAARFTGSVDKTIARITPAAAGVSKIGHFGFFRPDMQRAWDEALGWLLGAPAQRQVSSVGA